MVADSVKSKRERIVKEDPLEKGIRKNLEFGTYNPDTTLSESFAMKEGHPILHGYAVAYGLVCELYLCSIKTGFPSDKMRQTVRFIKDTYGKFDFV